jgi:hypothetical protein
MTVIKFKCVGVGQGKVFVVVVLIFFFVCVFSFRGAGIGTQGTAPAGQAPCSFVLFVSKNKERCLDIRMVLVCRQS